MAYQLAENILLLCASETADNLPGKIFDLLEAGDYDQETIKKAAHLLREVYGYKINLH